MDCLSRRNFKSTQIVLTFKFSSACTPIIDLKVSHGFIGQIRARTVMHMFAMHIFAMFASPVVLAMETQKVRIIKFINSQTI